MRSIRIKIVPRESVIIPFAHWEILQGLVYNLLSYDKEYSSELHDLKRGGTDAIKLFCFSDLRGRYRMKKEEKLLIYDGEFGFEMRSADDRFVEIIKERLESDPYIGIDDHPCRVVETEISERSFSGRRTVTFFMNTPVTVYRTNGRHTDYYSYRDAEFYDIVISNLKKKYLAVFGREYEGELLFECVGANEKSRCVTEYKNTRITGYYGVYLLTGDDDIIKTAYYCGLGSKNAMGFGTADIVF